MTRPIAHRRTAAELKAAHNPDGLTLAQLGKKPWRFLRVSELVSRNPTKHIQAWIGGDWDKDGWTGEGSQTTFRTKLTKAQVARLP